MSLTSAGESFDVAQLSAEQLREAVGLVFDEPFLFSDTIAANIALGRPDASAEEIRAAADMAAADEFVSALPDGYDTVVGERGLTLSGGQRQRIALARALLTDPRVLILDDATSAVDATTEASIFAALRANRGRTALILAHRRSTLSLADRVAVLDRGRIIDSGTVAELDERCPLFRALFASPTTRAPSTSAFPHRASRCRISACRPSPSCGRRTPRSGTCLPRPAAPRLPARDPAAAAPPADRWRERWAT